MALADLHRQAFWTAVTFPLLFVLGIIIALGITFGDNMYIGGIGWPYISDTAREGGAKSLMIAVSVSVCFQLWFVLLVHWGRMDRALQSITDWDGPQSRLGHCRRLNYASTGLWLFGAPFLPLLFIFDTAKYASEHFTFAYIAVTCAFLYTTLQTIMFGLLDKSSQDPNIKQSKTYKNIVYFFIIIFFLLYLPIGLGVVCDWSRLTRTECVAKNYGDNYCNVEMRYNDTETMLWKYDGCSSENELRSTSQHLLVISIMFYAFTLAFDMKKTYFSGNNYPRSDRSDVESGSGTDYTI